MYTSDQDSVVRCTIQRNLGFNQVAEFYEMSSALTFYFHIPKIRFLPLLLAKCSYSKKIEAGN
jgi:hypothetical protein